MRVLVTGGAGFIGSHLVDALVEGGHEVIILDNLEPRVHQGKKPHYLNAGATYLWQDIRDADAVAEATQDVEALFHLASLIDVEESMRDPGTYADVNVRGTAALLDAFAERPGSVNRLILASSVAVYGEGSYRCSKCGPVEAKPRPREQLQQGRWEILCPTCGTPLEPHATSEEARPAPLSTYGVTKLSQEKLFEAAAGNLGIPAVILRCANVYGPRQRPGPYAGVCTTFLERMQRGQAPIVHEDGLQTRDLIHVRDVVYASMLAMGAKVKGVLVANIGTGTPTTVLEVEKAIGELTKSELSPVLDGTFRPGDIRHLWVDTRRSRESLGFTSSIGLKEGVRTLVATLQ